MAGKKGRSGRRPFEITLAAKSAVERHKLLGILVDIAKNEGAKDSDRIAAVGKILDWAEAKPAQRVDVTSGDQPLLIIGAVPRA
jgi:hypothetical protein